jgi:hypothetical protein
MAATDVARRDAVHLTMVSCIRANRGTKERRGEEEV